jgi:hypothetical protein
MNRVKYKLFIFSAFNCNNQFFLYPKKYIINGYPKKLFLFFCFLSVFHINSSCQTTQIITTSGLSTWSVPNCVASVTVEVWGGGGGGGGGDIDTYSGSGGGGGGYSRSVVNVVGGTDCQLYVGAGGAGGKNSNGQDGEDSWFMDKTKVLAKGGHGGGTGKIIVVGKGGAKGIGDVAFSGGNGGKAFIPVELNTSGGGGGSSGGFYYSGYNGTDGANGLVNAPGAVAPSGGGSGGNGCGVGGAPTPDCAGFPGNIPGGGGGGGNDDIVLGTGGNGATGQIKLTWKAVDGWFTNKNREICTGTAFTISPVSGMDGDRFPEGTTYSWELPIVTGGITGATTQTSQPFISQTLVNSSQTVQTAIYLIKTSTGCNFTLTVKVFPQSQLITTLAPQAICSGTLFNYIPKGTTEDCSFTWKRATVAGIIQTGTTGTGTINETLTNTTNSPINVTYIYTTASNGCKGMEQNVVLTILPLPQFISALHPPAICSGTIFSYVPASTISGSTYSWTRAAISGIAQTASLGVDTIHETLTNTTSSPINVVYEFTTVAKGCMDKTQNVITVVNPAPQLSSSTISHNICSGSTFNYSPLSNTQGCIFNWERLFAKGIKEAAATGVGKISETLTNVSDLPITVTYNYTITANGCNGTEKNILITVNPLPQLNSVLNPPPICSGSTFTYSPSGTIQGSIYTWKRATVEGIGQPEKSGTGIISESLTNTTSSPINVTYIYNSAANGCKGKEQIITVKVYSSAQLSSRLNPNAICSGTTFNYIPSGTIPGSAFNWKRLAVNGIKQANSSGSDTINELLTNTTSLPVNVIYRYTTTAGGCEGKIQNVVVTVNPIPQLNSNMNSYTICSGSTFNYAPISNTPGCVYTWQRLSANITKEVTTTGVGKINEVLTNTTDSSIVVTYFYTITANGCEGKSQNISATVNPLPKINSTLNPSAICSGTTFTYTPTENIKGSVFTWKRAAVAGISQPEKVGTGSISESFTNTTSASINVTYIFTSTANGCKGTEQNVVVNIKPLPQLNNTLPPISICSGTAFNFIPLSTYTEATVKWNRAPLNGIAQIASSGVGSINDTLTNAISSPLDVTYTFTTTANGCEGKTQNLIVTVNPTPQLNNPLNPITVCSGTSLLFNAGTSIAGTTYEWTRASINGILQAASTGVGNINETLTNITAAAINVTYVYIAAAKGCKGKEQNLKVTVNPSPQLNSVPHLPAICSRTTFNYIPTGSAGSTFSWTRALISGIAQAGSSGIGTINETLTNTTASPINVSYVYTATANGCAGKPQNVMVTINPLPEFNSTPNPTAICSGTTFIYTPVSKTGGVTYSWSRSTIKGIIPAGTKGEDKINESLTNSTLYPINVTYVYSSSANGCKGADQNVVVAVTPLPQLNSVLNPPAICSGKAFNYTPTSANTGATFTWIRSSINGIEQTGSSGVGNINEVITNTTAFAINVIYSYTATDNGCKGKEQQVIVKVNPLPQLNSTLTPPAICSGTTFKYNATSAMADARFSWKRSSVYGISQTSSSGTGNVSELLTNTTKSPLTATYVYTTSANNCESTQNIVVIVNPLPTATIAGNFIKCLNDAAPEIVFTGSSSKPPYKFTYKINGGKNMVVTSDASGAALVTASTSVAGDFTFSLLSVAESSSELSCSQAQTGSAMVKVVQLEASLLGTTEVPVRGVKPILTFKVTGGKAPYTFTYTINEGETHTKSTLGSFTSASIVAPTDIAGDFVYTLINIKDANGLSCPSDATAIITVSPPNQNSKTKSSSGGPSKVKTPTIAPKNLIKLNRRYKIGK